MRLRKKAGTKEALLEMSPPLVLEPENLAGKWGEYFNNDNPLYLEIGTGKGNFLTIMAEENPEHNFIGLEMCEEVLVQAIKKAQNLNLSNIAFVWKDASLLEEIFNENEVTRIYLNFSDPWPKKRHAKRRLTHRNFLNKYKNLLSSKGEIHLKTDNKGLFEFSLNEFCDIGWKMKNISLDLYQNPLENNVPTEYELKFTKLGMPIYRLEAFYL